MGKWTEKSYDNELLKKVKILFEDITDKLNKEQPGFEFTYEKFVESFDETDKFNRRLFEFLIKETVQKKNRNRLGNVSSGQHRLHFPYFNSRNTTSSSTLGMESGGLNDASPPPSLSSQMREARAVRSSTSLDEAGAPSPQFEEIRDPSHLVRRLLRPSRMLPYLTSSTQLPLPTSVDSPVLPNPLLRHPTPTNPAPQEPTH